MDLLFYFLSALILLAAVGVVLFRNPLVSALSLAGTMITLAFMFFMLDAQFIAAVQLVVYAGAVMVLFVIVLMLFDLGHETEAFSGGAVSRFFKIVSGFALLGILAGAILNVGPAAEKPVAAMAKTPEQHMISVKALAELLYTQYVLAFEILGLLLLLVAVGVVAVSRIKGGTHAR